MAKAKAITTFERCAMRCMAAHEAGWRNATHRQQWHNTLRTYAYPIIGKLSADAIDTGLVMQILTPIWAEKNETASRLRGRIEVILDWGTPCSFGDSGTGDRRTHGSGSAERF